MEKKGIQKEIIVAALAVILIFVGIFAWSTSPKTTPTVSTPKVTAQPTMQQNTQQHRDTFSYDGEDGKDALTLLKEKTQVKQDQSGMVSAINGRTVDAARHEYWAFYVNGKMAEVGPASYQTKNGDKIEWKVEKY